VKKYIISGVAIVFLGLVVGWFSRTNFWSKKTTVTNNQNVTRASNTNSDQIWDPVIVAAQQTEVFTYGGLTFNMPINMIKSQGEGGVSWYFPVDIPDSPSITFSQPLDSAANLIQLEKSAMTPDQRIVREGSMIFHDQEWRYIELTTNLDINYTYWFSNHQPTVQVMYTQGRPDVMEIFDRVMRSAKTQ